MLDRRVAQAGFTLVELLVAITIASVLMAGFGAILWTAVQTNDSAGARLDAGAALRNVQYRLYRDVTSASSVTVNPASPGVLRLTGSQPSAGDPGQAQPDYVTYCVARGVLLRAASTGGPVSDSSACSAGGAAVVASLGAAGGATFAWTTGGPLTADVVVSTRGFLGSSFREAQRLDFWPRY